MLIGAPLLKPPSNAMYFGIMTPTEVPTFVILDNISICFFSFNGAKLQNVRLYSNKIIIKFLNDIVKMLKRPHSQ